MIVFRSCHFYKSLLLSILLVLLFLPGLIFAQTETVRERAQVFVDQGLELNDNSEQEAALYQQAIDLDPTYAEAYFNLGFVRQAQGRLEQAIAAYEECLRLSPKRSAAHRNLATCLLALRRDAALYEVRHHLNLAIELQEALPKQDPQSLESQKTELLELEKRINRVLTPPEPKGYYSSEAIVAILSRRITRGGQTLYEGPCLPLLLFNTGAAQLTSDNEPQLQALVKALKSPKLRDLKFQIAGHADGRGRAEFNLALSKKRAQSVFSWLFTSGGIDKSRLKTIWHGEDHPIFPNDSPVHFLFNRRLEILVWPEYAVIAFEKKFLDLSQITGAPPLILCL